MPDRSLLVTGVLMEGDVGKEWRLEDRHLPTMKQVGWHSRTRVERASHYGAVQTE